MGGGVRWTEQNRKPTKLANAVFVVLASLFCLFYDLFIFISFMYLCGRS